MQFVSVINGKLQLRAAQQDQNPAAADAFKTGFKALDNLLPPGGLQRGAVHEVLSENGAAWFFALLLAHSIHKSSRGGAVVWSDPQGELYPPALARALPVRRLYLLHIGNAKDELWAAAECLQCRGVGALILSPQRLSRIAARKLQLSAERGGGIGVVLRSARQISAPYAAATRWLVRPARGDESVQRWDVQLIHGHGGQIGKNVLLEVGRDTIDPDFVRAIDPLVHRPDQTQITRVPA